MKEYSEIYIGAEVVMSGCVPKAKGMASP